MNYDIKEQHNGIENYSDLMKEYLKNIPSKEYLDNINYDKPITTIEPLTPIKNNFNVLANKENLKGKEIDCMASPYQGLNESVERERKIERKKKLEYQQYLNQQIEEKKIRKQKEKEEQRMEEIMFEQKFFQEKAVVNNNKNNENKNAIIDDSNNGITNTNQITEELFLEHPKLKQIMERHQLTALIHEPNSNKNTNFLQQSNNQPLIIHQQQPLNDIGTAQIMNSYQQMTNLTNNIQHPPFNNQQNFSNGTTISTPIMNINQPCNNVSDHQLYTSNNNLLITNNRDNFSQIPISQSLNNIQRNHNINYPPILEKMLDYFFQEQVQIIKDYKETIEQLKNERDQALYLNKANDKRIQALERLKSDQVKFTTNYGFNPYENVNDKRLEATLSSILERELAPCHFKSKYEDYFGLDEESIFIEAEGKCSMIGESKFVKQTGEKKLIETWIKEEEQEDPRGESNNNKELSIENDISAITKQNICDDKSFYPDLHSLEKNDGKEKENSLSETNENICYPKFYRDDEDERESVKELSGEIMINKDNNTKQETSQMIVDINDSDYNYAIMPKMNPIYKQNLKQTLRYKEDNENENEINRDDNIEFHIETSDNNVNLTKKSNEEIKNHQNKSFTSNSSDNNKIKIKKSQRNNSISSVNNISNVSNKITTNINKDPALINQPNTLLNESNLNSEAKILTSKGNIPKEPYSPFKLIAIQKIIPTTETEVPKLSDTNPVESRKIDSDYFRQKESSMNENISHSYERELSKDNGDVFHNKMTFFEDNSQYDQESSIIKSSKHVIGNIYTAKTNPQIRVPPREATKKNISNMNSFYEKIKQKKKERQSTENSKGEEGALLDESLNTFNTNLRNDTMNEKIIQKVQKYTKVALNQIDQSQLSIFQKPK